MLLRKNRQTLWFQKVHGLAHWQVYFSHKGIWKWTDGFDFNSLQELTQEQRLEVSSKCQMLDPEHFSKLQSTGRIDAEYFVNNHFVDHYIAFKNVVRKIYPDLFVFMLTPVLEIPPTLKLDDRNIIDKKTVYCPHYYDGLSLMFKCWNVKYNVDTLGIMRNRYLNPVLGIVLEKEQLETA